MNKSEIETQLQDAQEKDSQAEIIRAKRVERVGPLGKIFPDRAVRVIEILTHPKLRGDDCPKWIGALSNCSPEAKDASIKALAKISSRRAIERLMWMASDNRDDMADIISALTAVQTKESLAAVEKILKKDALRDVPELQRYLSVKNNFNSYAQLHTIHEAERSISIITLSITDTKTFGERLKSSSAIPVLREVLNDAVNAVPSLAKNNQVKQAIEKLYAEVLKPD